MPRPLRLAAEGARGGRRAQPARAARRHRQRGRRRRASPFHVAGDRAPHRRHAVVRARALSPRSGRHPDHDARVALPDAHLERARAAAIGGDGDHRRDPRAGVDQTRRAHGAVAGTARADRCGAPLQRVGLSATQRPLDEVARFLGGARRGSQVAKAPKDTKDAKVHEGRRARRVRRPTSRMSSIDEFAASAGAVQYRDVTIIDASEPKRLDIRVQVPIEDMAQRAVGHGQVAVGRRFGIPAFGPAAIRSGPAAQIAGAAVDLDGDPSAAARADSVAPLDADLRQQPAAGRAAGGGAQRAGGASRWCARIMARWRARSGSRSRICSRPGSCAALVATSSLELGIDMGAIDLVVQIESPPSVASGLQRIGRAGHRIDEVSTGIIFPKFRGDLVACAAVTRAMMRGRGRAVALSAKPARRARAADRGDDERRAVGRRRSVRRRPRRRAVRRAEPARVRRRARHAVGPLPVGRVRRAAAARHVGPRATASSRARQGAKHVAIANAGTIPDRGLYGVFLLGADRDRARVGELDEEMVFEARVGETFLLGASTWRIEQITHDRVHRVAGAGPAGQDAVLERRSGRAADRARLRDRQAGARAAHSRSREQAAGAARGAARARRARGGQSPAIPRRSGARRRGGARRSHAASSSARATSSATGACSCCRRSAAASTRRGRWR